MNSSLLSPRSAWSLLPLAAIAAALFTCAGRSHAQSPVFTPDVNIGQNNLLAGKIPLRKVIESGGQFFTTPFTPADGVGEGATGPRSAQRAAMYPANPTFPFLRVNGLDSQSCYECHNTIGSYREPGTVSNALIRKPGTVSGSGGFNSNAFINPDFPHPLTELVRNPPHVFGVGYTQQLAQEMTFELQLLLQEAHAAAKANPGTAQSQPLASKTTSFGTFSTTYSATTSAFTDDFSKVVGVANDLVVRPLQWKGIASSVRHFVRDALDFHFSMQAVEKVGAKDCDKDGVINEVSVGNVSAIVSFVAMTRPPDQEIPAGQESTVALGAQLFEGKGSPRITGGMMCATCHKPSLKLDHAVLSIENPPPVDPSAPCPTEATGSTPTLIDPVASKDQLPVIRLFNHYLSSMKAPKKAKPAEAAAKGPASAHAANLASLKASVKVPLPPAIAYQIDLTSPGPSLPPYMQPRLPASADGSVIVPLFSDLRTHDMGDGLKDSVSQGADVAGISIPPRQFLTRPLWGVADTGPWLHDGRARTLLEAIQLHMSNGSEASPVITTFNQLNADEQQALIAFLLSLRLPVQQDLTIHN